VSSGGGTNVTVYDVDVSFDILETPQARRQHIRQFADWMWDFATTRRAAALPQAMGDKETYATRAVPLYDEMYINNPVGTYEITARYAPSTPRNWSGVLTSEPLKIRVIFKADFFDPMKPKG
jgi:hypothetical protein